MFEVVQLPKQQEKRIQSGSLIKQHQTGAYYFVVQTGFGVGILISANSNLNRWSNREFPLDQDETLEHIQKHLGRVTVYPRGSYNIKLELLS